MPLPLTEAEAKVLIQQEARTKMECESCEKNFDRRLSRIEKITIGTFASTILTLLSVIAFLFKNYVFIKTAQAAVIP